MTKIAETYVHIHDVLHVDSRDEFLKFIDLQAKRIASAVYDQNVEFLVLTKEGSIKLYITVVGSIYAGIVGYGALRTGIDYMINDAQEFSELMMKSIESIGIEGNDVIRFERRLGAPGKIKRLLDSIDKYENELNSISHSDRVSERYKIYQRLNELLDKIDFHEDRAILLGNIPETFKAHLPELPELPNSPNVTLLALKPDEFSLSEFNDMLMKNNISDDDLAKYKRPM